MRVRERIQQNWVEAVQNKSAVVRLERARLSVLFGVILIFIIAGCATPDPPKPTLEERSISGNAESTATTPTENIETQPFNDGQGTMDSVNRADEPEKVEPNTTRTAQQLATKAQETNDSTRENKKATGQDRASQSDDTPESASEGSRDRVFEACEADGVVKRDTGGPCLENQPAKHQWTYSLRYVFSLSRLTAQSRLPSILTPIAIAVTAPVDLALSPLALIAGLVH